MKPSNLASELHRVFSTSRFGEGSAPLHQRDDALQSVWEAVAEKARELLVGNHAAQAKPAPKRTPDFLDIETQNSKGEDITIHVTSRAVTLLAYSTSCPSGYRLSGFTFTKKKGQYCGGVSEFECWREVVKTVYQVDVPPHTELISESVRHPLFGKK